MSMSAHWTIVASQLNARIFNHLEGEEKSKLLKTLVNPLGREKNRALIQNQSGRGFRSEIFDGPKADAALQFARQISNFLDLSRRQGKFTSLTVAAEPHFLGKIKTFMKPQLVKMVSEWVKKDLQKIDNYKLTESLDIDKIPVLPA